MRSGSIAIPKQLNVNVRITAFCEIKIYAIINIDKLIFKTVELLLAVTCSEPNWKQITIT